MNYYVYYRVPAERSTELRSRVQALFETVDRECGIRGRWMRRRDDPTTYMEVYEGVRAVLAFEAVLQREGAKLGVERHVERFVAA